MARSFELKRFWRRYREHRLTKKRRRDSEESMALEEATATMVGLGLGMKQEEEYVEIEHDDDPRFINNPHGIGCSRTYEVPYDSATNSLSTSPASMRPLLRREINGSDDLVSFRKLGAWKAESIDMVKGKRKGRMPGDSADDRYKFLLDRSAKSSAKRFTLIRERA
ncbi:hypothetical protein IMSHALPRED_005319 [Imshaugia aleurites]|uniref:Uncharacterized protein n=1 Tax=Imshaugia aleurites TaxID=172621 RepID=A0A8H3FB32_9LECA|nr:hypothetical protein IMSHALPRED_005319 [Imshaugia aleurites]